MHIYKDVSEVRKYAGTSKKREGGEETRERREGQNTNMMDGRRHEDEGEGGYAGLGK